MPQRKRSTPTRGADRLEEYHEKRDFSRTEEPAGALPAAAHSGTLAFVVQKHAASTLHFDFRLELDGVMKSWAVPKGPSLDPSVKRLAMQVEDHPIEYNAFEGTIPKGEYGGGTVMLWDRGTYGPDREGLARTADDRSDVQILRDGYERGECKFVLDGERLQGSWVLVRTRPRRGASAARPQWLLIKHRDAYAIPGSDIVATDETSVTTGRTMEAIAEHRTPATRKSATRKAATRKPAARKSGARVRRQPK
jgi:bifunctional non-homologous end joining protein LigD